MPANQPSIAFNENLKPLTRGLLGAHTMPFIAPPLLPEIGEITIKQGRAEDCYLLASLSALLKYPQGRTHIKSMFQTLADGTVIVRIKSNDFSPRLLKKVTDGFLEGKYEFEQKGGYDIFKISPRSLDNIRATSAVETNADAVKILERLSSYYHTRDWTHMAEAEAEDMSNIFTALPISLLAHEIRPAEPRFNETKPGDFVAAILGIHTKPIDINKAEGLNFLKQLKHEDLTYPVYLDMLNTSGVGRHAYQLSRIETIPHSNNCLVYLINPYDNSKEERFTLDEIKMRLPRCFVYEVGTKTPGLNKIWKSTNFKAIEPEIITPELLLTKLKDIFSDPIQVRKLIELCPE